MRNFALFEYVLHELDDGSIRWEFWVKGKAGLEVASGAAFIEDETLFIRGWKIRDSAKFKDLDEFEAYKKTLSKWVKTKYFVTIYDRSNAILRQVANGDLVSGGVLKKIIPKLDYENF